MDDSCKQCEKAKECDEYLQQHYSHLLGRDSSGETLPLSVLKLQHDLVQKYKHLFESAPDAVFIADVESGLILDANQNAAKLLDIPVDEIIGMHQSRLHPAEEVERYKKVFRQHIEKGDGVFSDDIYVCHRDGQKISIQINATVTQIGSKKIIYGIFRDITEQQQHLRDIKAGHERFKRLAEAAFEAIAIHQNGKIIDVNQQSLDLFGYTLDEVKSIPCIQMIAPQSRALVEEKMAALYEGICEAFGMKKDGTIFPIEIQAKETVLDGQPIRIAAIRDMSELRASQERYKRLTEATFEGIVVHDQGKIIDVNQQYLDMFGYTLEELENIPHSQTIAPECMDLIQEKMASGYEGIYKAFAVKKDGTVFPIEVQARNSTLNGRPVRIAVFRDLTEQKMLEKELLKSNRKYKALYDEAPVALFRTALDGTLLNCNKACLLFFGLPQDEPEENYLNQINVGEHYVDPERRGAFIEALTQNKRVKHFEVELRKADGSTFWVSISAEVFPEAGYIEGAMYDITIRKSLTKSEHCILRILLKGKSNKEIARELRRSVRTIEDHRAHIMQKLGVDNLVDLTQKVLNLHNHYTEE
jgi:PAS domain S-box-containing protein